MGLRVLPPLVEGDLKETDAALTQSLGHICQFVLRQPPGDGHNPASKSSFSMLRMVCPSYSTSSFAVFPRIRENTMDTADSRIKTTQIGLVKKVVQVPDS